RTQSFTEEEPQRSNFQIKRSRVLTDQPDSSLLSLSPAPFGRRHEAASLAASMVPAGKREIRPLPAKARRFSNLLCSSGPRNQWRRWIRNRACSFHLDGSATRQLFPCGPPLGAKGSRSSCNRGAGSAGNSERSSSSRPSAALHRLSRGDNRAAACHQGSWFQRRREIPWRRQCKSVAAAHCRHLDNWSAG